MILSNTTLVNIWRLVSLAKQPLQNWIEPSIHSGRGSSLNRFPLESAWQACYWIGWTASGSASINRSSSCVLCPGHGERRMVCSLLLLLLLLESLTYFLFLAAGVSSSYSAGKLAQAVYQSFHSVLFGLALLVSSSLDSWGDTSECVASHYLGTNIWLHVQMNRIRLFTFICEKGFFYPRSKNWSSLLFNWKKVKGIVEIPSKLGKYSHPRQSFKSCWRKHLISSYNYSFFKSNKQYE